MKAEDVPHRATILTILSFILSISITCAAPAAMPPAQVQSMEEAGIKTIAADMWLQVSDNSSCVLESRLLTGTGTHYRGLTKSCYRFLPERVPGMELSSLHGFNERISVNNYIEMINFYIRLLHNSCD